jgi:hypothetical protein
MRKILTITAILFSIVWAKTFTVSDPPMVYIYHFVSYDSTSVLVHGSEKDESKDMKNDHKIKLFKLPLFNKDDISAEGDNIVIGKPLDPKLVSAMVTSAVAKYPHVKIAGESIQSRIISDNFIKLLKSYSYPERTDYIFLGEINTVASQYEVDLKLIDLSTQAIVSAETFNMPFQDLNTLRDKIEDKVTPVIKGLVLPFTGNVYIRVDSTSRNKIRWHDDFGSFDDIAVRPLKVTVGDKLTETTDQDYEQLKTDLIPTLPYSTTHDKLFSRYDVPRDLRLVSYLDDRSERFLAGNYRFRGFLKNNEDPVVVDFTVKPGDMNEIHISLPYIPPPKDTDGDSIPDKDDACPDQPGQSSSDPEQHGCPPKPEFGTINLKNIWRGLAFEVFDEYGLIAFGNNQSGEITLDADPLQSSTSSNNETASLIDIPLGTYVVNGFAETEEQFPGKHYVKIYSRTDTLTIKEAGDVITSTFPDRIIGKGREVVIYFDPFPPEKDDEYRLYVGNSSVPFTVARVAGEMHLVGIPTEFNDTLRVSREGFESAFIPIKSGKSRSYHIANLTLEAEETDEEKQSLFGGFKKN